MTSRRDSRAASAPAAPADLGGRPEPVIVRVFLAGRLLFEQAIGWIEPASAPGAHSWRGRFVPPRGERPPAGGPYVLETTDGRSGPIMIEPVAPGVRPDADVTFVGAGPLE